MTLWAVSLQWRFEIVRRAMIGFKDGQILLFQMTVGFVAGMQGEQERVIGIVGVEDQHGAEVEGVIAGNGREIRVEQVVSLFVKLGIVDTEGLVKISAGALDLAPTVRRR